MPGRARLGSAMIGTACGLRSGRIGLRRRVRSAIFMPAEKSLKPV